MLVLQLPPTSTHKRPAKNPWRANSSWNPFIGYLLLLYSVFQFNNQMLMSRNVFPSTVIWGWRIWRRLSGPLQCRKTWAPSMEQECGSITSSHLKSFLEPAVPPMRLFLMINMMPLKRCVVKGNYFTALLRNEARNKFLMSGPWLSVAKLRPLSFAAARWGCLCLLL